MGDNAPATISWHTLQGGGHYGQLNPLEFRWGLQIEGDTDSPRALMVLTDGLAFAAMTPEESRLGPPLRAPAVVAELVESGAMPPIAVVYIAAGNVLDRDGRPTYSHQQRSYEYDALSDQYVSFLLTELLPPVTAEVQLASEPTSWAMGGLSSGAVASFSATWHRPDRFGKVLSFIGSYVNIHGAHAYPSMIRKSTPRPTRVFLQSGTNDLENEHGSWALGNQQMAAALAYRGWDHRLEFGDGGHDTTDPARLLPDALTWLWEGWTAEQGEPWSPEPPATAYRRTIRGS
jgi:enterochelin esterase-like enzyme